MRLVVFRPIESGKQKGQQASEWLKGDTAKEDIESEAWALVEDPKDTIDTVKVFHLGWGQFLPLTFAKGWSYDGTHKLKEGEVDARESRTLTA